MFSHIPLKLARRPLTGHEVISHYRAGEVTSDALWPALAIIRHGCAHRAPQSPDRTWLKPYLAPDWNDRSARDTLTGGGREQGRFDCGCEAFLITP